MATNGIEQTESPSDLEKQIIRQIEYYFGDINLPKDKFLQNEIKQDDGWISMDTMLKFKRLASLSSETEVICKALLKSTTNLVEFNDDKTKIRRRQDKPLPVLNDDRRREMTSRSIYCKGFPTDGTTLDKVMTFFDGFFPMDNIQLRNYEDRATKTWHFKGSVFAMFKNQEDAEKFMGLESVRYEEIELTRKWQSDYFEEKKKERAEKRTEQGNKCKKEEVIVKHDKGNSSVEELPKGTVLHMKGFSGDVTVEDIKSKLEDMGCKVAYVEYSKGDSEAWVRLQRENSAKEVVESANNKMDVCELEIDVRVLEGEEEEKYLRKAKQELEKLRRNKFMKKGKKNFRGRGKGFKRKGDRDYDEPSAKK